MAEAEAAVAAEVEADDVANEGEAEEDFVAGMRQNAMDYQAHDVDQDHKLDFNEFCALVRDREEGDFTTEELRARFEALDADGSGKVDLHEYVRFSLRDALYRSSARVIDLFRKWDTDESGEIDKKEFRKAIRSMGFNFFADDAEIDMVFDDFDLDKSGQLDYKELNKQLRAQAVIDASLMPGAAGEISMSAQNKSKLRRRDPNQKAGTTKHMSGVQFDESSPVLDQLQNVLAKHAVRVIDLFREWDEDNSGTVSKKEFGKALRALGVTSPKEDIDFLFESFDTDGSGMVDYNEFNKALRLGGNIELDEKLRPGGAGPLEIKPTNKSPLPGRKSGGGGRGSKDKSPKRSTSMEDLVMEDLWKTLAKNANRLIDLFRKWDLNGDGKIDRKEWSQAIPLIGVRTTSEHIDRCADSHPAAPLATRARCPTRTMPLRPVADPLCVRLTRTQSVR